MMKGLIFLCVFCQQLLIFTICCAENDDASILRFLPAFIKKHHTCNPIDVNLLEKYRGICRVGELIDCMIKPLTVDINHNPPRSGNPGPGMYVYPPSYPYLYDIIPERTDIEITNSIIHAAIPKYGYITTSGPGFRYVVSDRPTENDTEEFEVAVYDANCHNWSGGTQKLTINHIVHFAITSPKNQGSITSNPVALSYYSNSFFGPLGE